MSEHCYKVDVSVDEQTGRVQAVYFRVRKGKVAETIEVVDGKVNADYDAQGQLLGVEMLGPCEAAVLDQLGSDPEAVAFIRRAAPAELVSC